MNANVIARKLEELSRKGAIKSVDVANLLGTRPETVSRWNQGKAFPRPDSQRLLVDLEYVVDLLADFYEPLEARLWLFSRQKLLDGALPAELIAQGKASDVVNVITQLREGVHV